MDVRGDFSDISYSQQNIQDDSLILDRVAEALQLGTEFIFSTQQQSGLWMCERSGGPSTTAKYVLFASIFPKEFQLENQKTELLGYFLNQQNEKDGSWHLHIRNQGDLSVTAEVYLALRVLGISDDSPELLLAKNYILKSGGIEKVSIPTQVLFALFGILPWDKLPVIPAEFILFSEKFPIHFQSLSPSAQGILAPLMILQNHRPVFALPNGKHKKNPLLNHLIPTEPDSKTSEPGDFSIYESLPEPSKVDDAVWINTVRLAQPLFKLYSRIPIRRLRDQALKECEKWIVENFESDVSNIHLWGIMLSTLALHVQDYSRVPQIIQNVQRLSTSLLWEDSNGLRLQMASHPELDTAQYLVALLDSNCHSKDERIVKAAQALNRKQSEIEQKDMFSQCVIQSALMKHNPETALDHENERNVNRILQLQNEEGGWGRLSTCESVFAFSRSYKDPLLELFDVSTPLTTSAALQTLSLYIQAPHLKMSQDRLRKIETAIHLGVEYLAEFQNQDGSWSEKGNLNYLYGTSHVLQALSKLNSKFVSPDDPMILKGVDWLKKNQLSDGGFGSSKSSPTATGLGILGLLSFLPPSLPAIQNGIDWLVKNQMRVSPDSIFSGGFKLPDPSGFTWREEAFSLEVLPQTLFTHSKGDQHAFPMMALGRYFEKSLEG